MVSSRTIVNIMDYSPYIGTGSDDSPYIQQAVNDIISNGNVHGYTLFFPPGVYLYQYPVLLFGIINILGAGNDNTTFLAAPGLNNYIFYFFSVTQPALPTRFSRNLVGRLNFAAQQQYNASGRMRVSASLSGIAATISNITFDGNMSTQTAGGCVYAGGALHSIFNNVHFTRAYDYGLWLDQIDGATSGKYNVVDSCRFDEGLTSAGFGGGLNITVSNKNMITKTTFEHLGGTGSGGNTYAVADYSDYNAYELCSITNSRNGFYLHGAGQRVIGCTIDSPTKRGIYLAGDRTNIIGNTFEGGGSDTTNTYANIEIASSNHSIVGNKFYQASSGTLRSYIKETSGDNNVIDGNYFPSPSYTGTAVIEKTGNHTVISNNPGYNPVGNISSPTLPASGIAYTNILGVNCMVSVSGGTVTVIAIGGVTTGLTSGNFRVPVGQSITITYTVAPTWMWFGD